MGFSTRNGTVIGYATFVPIAQRGNFG